ncbi:hypothetical protein O988_04210 [Pseudogymnoascus sp. VKM F-3808]|nr:hypothetical protein O988_04210 [Pseudogymnoascus sp. VKM F-3808]
MVELPIAPGTSPDCEGHVDYFTISAAEADRLGISGSINSCIFATTAYEVTLGDFLSWNPSLASIDPCMLQEGYRYCALNSTSHLPPLIIEDNCLEYYADHPYPGTISTCTCFTAVNGFHVDPYICSEIAYDFDITIAQLTFWNPWVGTDCDAGMYSGLGRSDSRAVCVGVSGSDGPITSLTTTTLPFAATAPTSAATTPLALTQTGIVAGCTRYHTAIEGDGCCNIADAYSVTLDQFYMWNLAVGNDCAGLWLGCAYYAHNFDNKLDKHLLSQSVLLGGTRTSTTGSSTGTRMSTKDVAAASTAL